MKATILLFTFGLIGLAGCAVDQGGPTSGMRGDQPAPLLSFSSPGSRSNTGFGGGAGAASASPEDLLLAAARGDLRGVQGALAQGALVDARNPNGATPLLLAASSGYLPVVQTLLGAGADANMADGAGRTPLTAATAGGYDDVARALKAAGARGAAAAPAASDTSAPWYQK